MFRLALNGKTSAKTEPPSLEMQVIRLLNELQWPQNHVRKAFSCEVRHKGWTIIPRFPVQHYGGSVVRMIDFVISDGKENVAVEIDRKQPRRKSVQNLWNFPGGRVIVLQRPTAFKIANRIHVVGVDLCETRH